MRIDSSLKVAIFLVHCLAYVHSYQQYEEALIGNGLIGSHFGIPGLNATFDYVIVGGGTAGLTVATRLAENTAYSIAVIEAGGFPETDNGNLTSIPAFNSYWVGKSPAIRNPLVDWGVYTLPMEGMGGRSMQYASGKTLGGGSSRNSMTYHRPSVGAFQNWADLVNDQSYLWTEIEPYFKKSCNFQPPNTSKRPSNATVTWNASSWDTDGAPLKIGFPNWSNAFSTYAKLALEELGLVEQVDLNSGVLNGFQYTTIAMDAHSQTRSSAETSFLRKAFQYTTNLSVYKSTLAKRIIFDEEKRATGVLVDTAGVQYILSANKEVILSAGAFRSPQLLMVSGIGPKAELQKHSIALVAELPGVGQNLQDHVQFGLSYEVNLITHSTLQRPSFESAHVTEYLTNRTGILTNTASEFLGFGKFPSSMRQSLQNTTSKALDAFPEDWPELEYIFADGWAGNLDDFTTGAPVDGKNYASIAIGLETLFSRGNITLNSTDTQVNPIVNPNLLGDFRDRDIAVLAFKRVRQIAATGAMRQIIIDEEASPGMSVTSDEEIIAFLEKNADTIYHAACTCKMGTIDDPMAVVDSNARVIGVKSLRVIDASALALLPPGHPTSVVYALAEKISHQMITEG